MTGWTIWVKIPRTLQCATLRCLRWPLHNHATSSSLPLLATYGVDMDERGIKRWTLPNLIHILLLPCS